LGALLVLASACGEGDPGDDGVGDGSTTADPTATGTDTTAGPTESGPGGDDPDGETTGGDEDPETDGGDEDPDTGEDDNGDDPCEPFDNLPFDELIEAMSDDVDDIEDDADRVNTRYISCAHLANQGLCGEDLQLYTDAVKKLVASTTREQDFDAREVAGTNGTVFAIDISDLGWDVETIADVFDTRDIGNDVIVEDVVFEDRWEMLVTGSPYAFVPDLGDDNAVNLVEETDTFEPFLMCDAFIEIASRSDKVDVEAAGLYNELADIPARLFSIGNNDSLEELLDIDIAQDIIDEEVVRAGVFSPVNTQGESLMERHDGGNGETVWLRYDRADAGQLSVDPINFADFDVVNQVFLNVDNAEVIYSLPNNFFAYMAVDLNGLRVDAIDGAVFNDPALATDKGGDTLPAMSCMGCHDGVPLQGLTDEVRDLYVGPGASEPNGDIDEEDVEAIYPEPDDLTDAIDDDSNEVLGELEQILDSTEFDGVQRGYLDFRSRVGALKAETELHLEEGDLEEELGVLDDQFSVFEDDLEVSRDAWEDFFPLSICDTDIADDEQCDNDAIGTLNSVNVRPSDNVIILD
jgi:hypothetical protein